MDAFINLKISRILRLLPPQDHSKSHYAYHGILVTSILIVVHSYNLVLRLESYKNLKNLEKVLDVFIHTFTTITNVNSVIVATFFLKKHWKVLLKEHKRPLLRTTCSSSAYFYILSSIHGLLVYFEVNYHIRRSVSLVVNVIPPFVNIFLILVSVLNINYYENELKNMLCGFRLNLKAEKNALERISKREVNPYLVSRLHARQSKADDHLPYFVEILYRTKAFNKIYGWQILNFAVIVLVHAYVSLNLLLTAFFQKWIALHPEFVIINLLKCLNLLIYATLLIHPCFRYNCEMDKVGVLCRKMLIALPGTVDNGSNRHLRLKLIFLLKQIEARKPYFSAAGFFEVDYAMLLYILNGITSYLMVTLQTAF